ncbi:predicted protein [Postia placenta Mad-698-R]|nr:predicted protein [Postia placenta Mad-698-R]
MAAGALSHRVAQKISTHLSTQESRRNTQWFMNPRLANVAMSNSFPTIWSKIKEKKGANDSRKGALYSKAHRVSVVPQSYTMPFVTLQQDIVIAVRTGGSVDPEQNTTLAAVMKRCRSQGVPNDNIESALKKIAGAKDRGDQHLTYEVMAPGSIGLIIECLSDNINRTMHAVRNLVTGHGARIAPVKFMFSRKGSVKVALDKQDGFENKLDSLIEHMLDSGAEDFKETAANDTEVEMEFLCQPQDLAQVTAAASGSGLCRDLLASELVYSPVEEGEAIDEDTTQKLAELVQELEDHDDVLRVWTTHSI